MEHLRTATELLFAVLRDTPYLITEKNEERKLKAQENKRKREELREQQEEDSLAQKRQEELIAAQKKDSLGNEPSAAHREGGESSNTK